MHQLVAPLGDGSKHHKGVDVIWRGRTPTREMNHMGAPVRDGQRSQGHADIVRRGNDPFVRCTNWILL